MEQYLENRKKHLEEAIKINKQRVQYMLNELRRLEDTIVKIEGGKLEVETLLKEQPWKQEQN